MEAKSGKGVPSVPAADRRHEEYDAPAVERVMTAEDLQREIQYAGFQTVSDPN
jgi:hypothetical protein